ncbi:MAG TPA: hypothetical protein VL523_04170 [Terriglobia bacterium]|nr:hypothetical protein [Terriglobia bacterium]
MNRKMLLAFVMVSGMALAAVGPAWAQDPGAVNATIPFAFNVGAKVLPAGNYEIRRLLAGTLVIKNADTRDCATALVMDGAPKDLTQEAELVFHQYGDSRFLSQVSTRDTQRELSMSKLERREASKASEAAANHLGSRVIYVAARAQ